MARTPSHRLLGFIVLTAACAPLSLLRADVAAPPAPAPAAPRPLPATSSSSSAPAAPALSPAQLALASDVIHAMHLERVSDGLAQQMKQMAASMARGAGSSPADKQKKMAAIQIKIEALSIESQKDLLSTLARVYGQTFSTDELRAMKAFYLSPVGRAIVEKQPLIAQRMYPLVSQAQRALIPRIQQIVKEETGTSPMVIGPHAGSAPAARAPGALLPGKAAPASPAKPAAPVSAAAPAPQGYKIP